MDHLITISCQDTPDNLTLLKDFAEAWSLRFQRWQLEQIDFRSHTPVNASILR